MRNFEKLEIIHLKELELSPRIFHALRRGGVVTVAELDNLVIQGKLYEFNNIGDKSVDEILTALKKFKESISAEIIDEKNRNYTVNFT